MVVILPKLTELLNNTEHHSNLSVNTYLLKTYYAPRSTILGVRNTAVRKIWR